MLLLLLGQASAPLAAGALPAAAAQRRWDPVVVATGQLGLPGVRDDRRVDHYRLYRASSPGFVPIPYQFDERDEEGDLVFDSSKPDWRFDDKDELVFMARDSGEQAGPGERPPGCDHLVEIQVLDPEEGRLGSVYLAHYAGLAPRRSPRRYVRYDPKSRRVHTPFYSIAYRPHSANFASFHILPAAGGSGVNLIRRIRVRIEPTFFVLLTTWSPVFTGESLSVRLAGVRNGPVRVVRRLRQHLDLGRFFPDPPAGTTYTTYYASYFETPTVFSVPWLVLKALRGFRFTGATDFADTAGDLRYWDAANPCGLLLDGDHPPVVTDRDHAWYVVSGTDGTLMHVFQIPEEWRRWGIARGTVLEEDGAALGLGENGSAPGPPRRAVGYSLLHMTQLRHPGRYHMKMDFFVLPGPYRPGDEAGPLALVERPLRVEVRHLF